MKLKDYVLSVIFLTLPSQYCSAQIDVAKVWNILTLNIAHDDYRFYFEPQLRVQDAPNMLDQFLTNVGAGYRISPYLTVWVGSTSLIIGSLSANVPDTSEFRTWQQTVISKKLNPFNLQLRTRLEERKREGFSTLNYRFRNRLTVKKPFYQSLGWVCFNELFINLNRPIWITSYTIDQNRFFIGLDQKMSDKLTLSVGYLNQYIVSKEPLVGHVASLYAQLEIDN